MLVAYPGITSGSIAVNVPSFLQGAEMNLSATLMKADRDAGFVETNKDGVKVNRWPTMGFLAGCATSNETGWLTYKLVRGLGILAVENQARI